MTTPEHNEASSDVVPFPIARYTCYKPGPPQPNALGLPHSFVEDRRCRQRQCHSPRIHNPLEDVARVVVGDARPRRPRCVYYPPGIYNRVRMARPEGDSSRVDDRWYTACLPTGVVGLLIEEGLLAYTLSSSQTHYTQPCRSRTADKTSLSSKDDRHRTRAYDCSAKRVGRCGSYCPVQIAHQHVAQTSIPIPRRL